MKKIIATLGAVAALGILGSGVASAETPGLDSGTYDELINIVDQDGFANPAVLDEDGLQQYLHGSYPAESTWGSR